MRDERQALLIPDPADLPVLFEASRLLGRHADLSEAMGPLLTLLDDKAGLRGGIAALSDPDDGYGDVRIVAVADPADAALNGKRVPLGEGLLGKALAAEASVSDGEAFAVPVVSGGTAAGALSFSRTSRDRDAALALAIGVAALVAEAIGLRRRLSRENRVDESVRGRVLPLASDNACPPDEGWAPATIVGRSAPMRELFAMMDRVASTETTVLITGESGTGKELVARALHERSRRSRKSFVAVNCAALPENLLESELFGYEKGAFTGATARKPGKFEIADKGTILLDEVTEMDLRLQAKLLRVLQEREVEVIGSKYPKKVDVKVMATTNRNIGKLVAEGKFREDLYYRLHVFPIIVPPLRERREDIPELVSHFLKKYARGRDTRVDDDALAFLKQRQWKGNVRELENAVARACILCDYTVIKRTHLEEDSGDEGFGAARAGKEGVGSVREMEMKLILEALESMNGNRTRAASVLGITARTLRNKIREYRDLGFAVP